MNQAIRPSFNLNNAMQYYVIQDPIIPQMNHAVFPYPLEQSQSIASSKKPENASQNDKTLQSSRNDESFYLDGQNFHQE